MSDIRRSILWVIFAFSLVLLWDAWQVHNGRPKTFFPAPQDQPAASAPATGAQPVAALPGAVPAVADAAAAPAIPRQTYVVSTDLLKLSFDSEGGSLIGADLLKHLATGQSTPVQLLLQNNQHTYVAQTGLLGSSALPNHKVAMRLVGQASDLADGQDSLSLRFESAPVNGVVLAKTYTLQRGAYDIAVRHEVHNQGNAAITPQLYRQLVRDGGKTESETPFYTTFTGPAVYTEEQKFQKVEFDDIADNKASFVKTSNDGYVAMVQHYFATAWLLDAGTARENFVRQVAEADGIFMTGGDQKRLLALIGGNVALAVVGAALVNIAGVFVSAPLFALLGGGGAGDDLNREDVQVIGTKGVGNRGTDVRRLVVHSIHQLDKSDVGRVGKPTGIDDPKSQAWRDNLYSFKILNGLEKSRLGRLSDGL